MAESKAEETPDFSGLEYWESRYAEDAEVDEFEWHLEYEVLEPFVKRLIPSRHAEVLVPGCGCSSVAGKLYRDGYQNLTCVDFSPTVIARMQAKYEEMTIDWVVMDARRMDVPTRCFDVVLDKGLLDACVCASDSAVQVGRLLAEMHRVLRVGGLYIVVSYGQPGTRVVHFEACPGAWRHVDTIKIPKPPVAGFAETADSRHYYMYVMERR